MSAHQAFRCNRCRTLALDELPKGWIEGRGNDQELLHTCPRCRKMLEEIGPFLDWIASRLVRLVSETEEFSDLFSEMWCRDCGRNSPNGNLNLWWEDYSSGVEA